MLLLLIFFINSLVAMSFYIFCWGESLRERDFWELKQLVNIVSGGRKEHVAERVVKESWWLGSYLRLSLFWGLQRERGRKWVYVLVTDLSEELQLMEFPEFWLVELDFPKVAFGKWGGFWIMLRKKERENFFGCFFAKYLDSSFWVCVSQLKGFWYFFNFLRQQ